MIRAIIFDFYGVIRSDDYHNWLNRHDIDRSRVKGATKELDRGLVSVEEFYQTLSQASNMSADQIRQEFKTKSHLNEQILALILKLKEHYKVAILSNANSPALNDILSSAKITGLFDEIIASSEIGYIKPSKEIFVHTLKKLHVEASEAIFIDDNPDFVRAAKDLGLVGICYRNFDDLMKTLNEAGISI